MDIIIQYAEALDTRQADLAECDRQTDSRQSLLHKTSWGGYDEHAAWFHFKNTF